MGRYDAEAGMQRMMADIEAELAATREFIHKDRFDPRVMQAMRSVPRHEFIPGDLYFSAYSNGPVAIGYGQTISQPYIVALMTDLIEPGAGDVVLDVGTGSGYQAAVLSRLVKKVYSIENVAPLADAARERLQRLGYDNVEVCTGDGYFGWPEHAPYDGILVAAATRHVPEPLVEQLKPGARLVLPVGGEFWGQSLKCIEKESAHGYREQDVLGVAFVPLTGTAHDQPAGKTMRGSQARDDTRNQS